MITDLDWLVSILHQDDASVGDRQGETAMETSIPNKTIADEALRDRPYL
jgi:hypothetical protein